MIKYIQGDLLEAPQKVIVHQCNCQGVMGSGVAFQIRRKYPSVYNVYMKGLSHSKLGDFIPAKVDGKIFINLLGQDHFLPRGVCHTDYAAVRKALESLKDYCDDDLAMPKIGCGLGGGDWKIMSALIEEIFTDRDVYVYEWKEII